MLCQGTKHGGGIKSISTVKTDPNKPKVPDVGLSNRRGWGYNKRWSADDFKFKW